jgi:hypothetical protein
MAREHFQRSGFGEIRMPLLESTDLFSRGIGEATDAVGKEMYSFQDRGDRSCTLRPEGTASVVHAAIRICSDLLEEGAQLAIHDPKVAPAQIARDLKLEAAASADALSGTGSWGLAESVETAVAGADAVLILTEWRQYRVLDWQELAGRMRKPAWVFDARAVADPQQVRAAGLTLWRVGDGEG